MKYLKISHTFKKVADDFSYTYDGNNEWMSQDSLKIWIDANSSKIEKN